MTSYVDHLANKKQPANLARLHGFTGELVSIYATQGDFSFVEAFRACGSDGPLMQLSFKARKVCVGPPRGEMSIKPACCESIRQRELNCGACGADVSC